MKKRRHLDLEISGSWDLLLLKVQRSPIFPDWLTKPKIHILEQLKWSFWVNIKTSEATVWCMFLFSFSTLRTLESPNVYWYPKVCLRLNLGRRSTYGDSTVPSSQKSFNLLFHLTPTPVEKVYQVTFMYIGTKESGNVEQHLNKVNCKKS